MAKKMNPAKLGQETRGHVEIKPRQPMNSTSAFYLMQLRTRAIRISVPKHRVTITIDPETSAEIPYPVKIIHGD